MEYPTRLPDGYPEWLDDPRAQVVLDLVLTRLEMLYAGLAHDHRDEARAQLAAARDDLLDEIERESVDLPRFADDDKGEVALVTEFLLARSYGRLLGVLNEADRSDGEIGSL